MYFRTLIGQIFAIYLLERILEIYPDILIHDKDDPLNALINAIRFFVNPLMSSKDQDIASNIVAYLVKIVSALTRGEISKNLKDSKLLVPNAKVLKISGHKFMCLTPLLEAQKLKNDSNFALILNHATCVFLGLIFENWKTFEKFFNPRDNGNYDNIQGEINAALNSTILSTLTNQLSKAGQVISSAKRTGSRSNSNPQRRTRNQPNMI